MDTAMGANDSRLMNARCPRASKYHPDWMIGAGCGANPVWLAEWLCEAVPLEPGMRVLDLGCGRASSSIFLAREFGVQVWATDLWFNATENHERIRDAGLGEQVFAIHSDAHSLPFAGEFFDAVVCLDSYIYFGTDVLYLNYLCHFVKPGGWIGVAGAGLMQEVEGEVPEHLRAWWTGDLYALFTAEWLRRHWARPGLVSVEVADTMPEGWRIWVEWQRAVAPENVVEIEALGADAGRTMGYVRGVARRRTEVTLVDYCWPDPLRSLPANYVRQPLLRDG